MKILATRKEDELYFQGPFWIIADTFKDILRGKFALICEKYPCDYNGEYENSNLSKSQKTHSRIWKEKYSKLYNTDDYTFYPRGRVSVYRGTAFIHINSRCNIPSVIDKVIEEYCIGNLQLEIDLNDTYQGSHYDFKLT